MVSCTVGDWKWVVCCELGDGIVLFGEVCVLCSDAIPTLPLIQSIDSVSFPQFMLANLLVQPRLLVPVFIGSRLNSLAGEGGPEDPIKKWVNLGSIIIGMSVSFTSEF